MEKNCYLNDEFWKCILENESLKKENYLKIRKYHKI